MYLDSSKLCSWKRRHGRGDWSQCRLAGGCIDRRRKNGENLILRRRSQDVSMIEKWRMADWDKRLCLAFEGWLIITGQQIREAGEENGWMDRTADKWAWLGRCADTRWMVCGHGCIWVVALYIREAFHCRISARDKPTIPAGKEMCDQSCVSLSINCFPDKILQISTQPRASEICTNPLLHCLVHQGQGFSLSHFS